MKDWLILTQQRYYSVTRVGTHMASNATLKFKPIWCGGVVATLVGRYTLVPTRPRWGGGKAAPGRARTGRESRYTWGTPAPGPVTRDPGAPVHARQRAALARSRLRRPRGHLWSEKRALAVPGARRDRCCGRKSRSWPWLCGREVRATKKWVSMLSATGARSRGAARHDAQQREAAHVAISGSGGPGTCGARNAP